MSRSLRKVIEASPPGTQFTREGLLAVWDDVEEDAILDGLGVERPRCWRFGVGRKGVNRVTVYERVPRGPIQLEWWDVFGRHRQSLASMAGHPIVDRKLARDVARAWAAGTIGPGTVPNVPAFVYFVEAVGSGRIKIGLTKYPNARFQNLRTSAAMPLDVLAVVPTSLVTERQMHDEFADLREQGEWFRDDRRLRDAIRQLLAGRAFGTWLQVSERAE